MDQSICNGHHNLETHKHQGEQGVGRTIITPRDTLAQFAVIDSTTAVSLVWWIQSPLFSPRPSYQQCSDKSPNKKDITLHLAS